MLTVLPPPPPACSGCWLQRDEVLIGPIGQPDRNAFLQPQTVRPALSSSLLSQLIVESPEGQHDGGGAWHSSVPCRPTSCTGRDPEHFEPALCAAALGQSRRAWNHDTLEVAGSNPALGARRHADPTDTHPPTNVLLMNSVQGSTLRSACGIKALTDSCMDVMSW